MTTTVTITIPATAPQTLIDHLTAFARDLDLEGITTELDLAPACTICNCTDNHACPGGCAWATEDHDLCTSCTEAFTHTEHATVTTWAYFCIDGTCDHTDRDGNPINDLTACPSTDIEVCTDCMHTAGHTRDEENWDIVPLTPWPCDHTAREDGSLNDG